MCPILLARHHSAELVECLPVDTDPFILHKHASPQQSLVDVLNLQAGFYLGENMLKYTQCFSNLSHFVLQYGLQCSELEGQGVRL